MKVLSLFDGMACGALALHAAGIKIDRYVAYEIDKYAVRTSTHNFPFVEHKGDVFKGDFTEYKDFDLLCGGSPCFVAGTMVKTKGGFKAIEDIAVGDYVLTHKGHYKKVKEVMARVANGTVIIQAENCGKIECTDEHPFYTKTISRTFNNSIRCYERICGDEFLWRNPKQFETVRNSSGSIMEQTYLTTVTDSVRNLPKYRGTDIKVNQFSSKRVHDLNLEDRNIWYIIGRWLGDGWFNYKYRKGKRLSGIKICCGKSETEELQQRLETAKLQYYKSEERTVVKFVISSVELAEFLQTFGVGAANKHISEDVFTLPDDLALSFLDGYFDADGHIENGVGSYTTVSKELAYGIKYMINKYYKMPCTISKKQNHSNNIEGRDLTVRDIYTGVFRSTMRKQSHHVVDGNYILAPYKSVSRNDGERMVYNLSVEDDESYTANGLVVHNCTYWSIAQKNNRETQASGIGWELFQQYVRALKEAEPKFFIYENNKSMSKAIRESITETFGFEPICINSALVSAQNRQRLYWVGKRNADGTYSKVDVQQPEDRGILLRDILENGTDLTGGEKSYCLTSSYNGAVAWNTIERNQRNMVAEPLNTTADGKSQTSKAQYQNTNQQNICCYKSTYGASGVGEPVRVGCMPSPNGEIKNSQAMRVYSVDGKSVNQTAQGGGLGAKTGLYAAPCGTRQTDKTRCLTANYSNATQRDFRKDIETNGQLGTTGVIDCFATPIEWNEQGEPIKAISGVGGKTYTVYKVENGYITIKDKQYPIKLANGYYIIRKLTVRECMRLQTVPEWYEFPVSNSQAYKMLGNGWTIEVIVHILGSIKREIQNNTEIVA